MATSKKKKAADEDVVKKSKKAAKELDAPKKKGKKGKEEIKKSKKPRVKNVTLTKPTKKSKKVKTDKKKSVSNIVAAPEDFKDKQSPMYVKGAAKWTRTKYEWDIPNGFKPFWAKVTFTTAQDGMMNGGVQALRYVGAIEQDKDLRKVFDMNMYDATTVQALATRLAMVTFHSTGKPRKNSIGTRLPADTTFELHVRVSSSKGVSLKAAVNKVYVVGKKGVLYEVHKKDPAYRYIRRVNQHLAAAFTQCLEVPKGQSMHHIQKQLSKED